MNSLKIIYYLFFACFHFIALQQSTKIAQVLTVPMDIPSKEIRSGRGMTVFKIETQNVLFKSCHISANSEQDPI